jgi:hypothetical protein
VLITNAIRGFGGEPKCDRLDADRVHRPGRMTVGRHDYMHPAQRHLRVALDSSGLRPFLLGGLLDGGQPSRGAS